MGIQQWDCMVKLPKKELENKIMRLEKEVAAHEDLQYPEWPQRRVSNS